MVKGVDEEDDQSKDLISEIDLFVFLYATRSFLTF